MSDAVREAARALLDKYVELVRSGDAGSWDPESDDEVIAMRAALELDRPEKGGGDGLPESVVDATGSVRSRLDILAHADSSLSEVLEDAAWMIEQANRHGATALARHIGGMVEMCRHSHDLTKTFSDHAVHGQRNAGAAP